MQDITSNIFNNNEEPYVPQEESTSTDLGMQSQPDGLSFADHTPKPQIDWLSTSQVMQLFKISSGTLYKWRFNHRLPYSKIKRKIYYKLADLDAFLNIHYYKPHKI